MLSLIDWCAALRAAFAGNDPDRVSTLQAGGAAASRYLSKSDRSSSIQGSNHLRATYRHGGDTFDFVYARNSEPIDGRTQAHCSPVCRGKVQ